MPVALLLEQLQSAGITKQREADVFSEEDKSRLLDHLRQTHGSSRKNNLPANASYPSANSPVLDARKFSNKGKVGDTPEEIVSPVVARVAPAAVAPAPIVTSATPPANSPMIGAPELRRVARPAFKPVPPQVEATPSIKEATKPTAKESQSTTNALITESNSEVKRPDKNWDMESISDEITKNWKKTEDLFKRSEWSTVIIRAATVVELASNLLIHKELHLNRGLPQHFVLELMKWANGVMGKFERLLLPIYNENPEILQNLKKLRKECERINNERNGVAHRGMFKKKETAVSIMQTTVSIVNALTRLAGTNLTIVFDEESDDEN
jgi:hypothetical protein